MNVTAEYARGEWIAVVAGSMVALTSPATPPDAARALWQAGLDDLGFAEYLRILSWTRFSELPGFALVCVGDEQAQLFVRGAGQIVVENGEESAVFTAPDAMTWKERTISLPAAMIVRVAQVSSPLSGWPLNGGIADAGSLQLMVGGEDAPEQAGDRAEELQSRALASAKRVAEAEPVVEPEAPEAVELEAEPVVEPDAPPIPQPPVVEVAAVPVAEVDAVDVTPVARVQSAPPAPPAPEPAPMPEPVTELPVPALMPEPAPVLPPPMPPVTELSPAPASISEPPMPEPPVTELSPAPLSAAPVGGPSEPVGPVTAFDGAQGAESGDGVDHTVSVEDLEATRGAVGAAFRIRIGSSWLVTLETPVLIGRAPQPWPNHVGPPPRLITVPSPMQDISRTHVEVRQESATVVVTDLHSTNGVLVTAPGRPPYRLYPGEANPIEVGSVVDLGDEISFTVELAD